MSPLAPNHITRIIGLVDQFDLSVGLFVVLGLLAYEISWILTILNGLRLFILPFCTILIRAWFFFFTLTTLLLGFVSLTFCGYLFLIGHADYFIWFGTFMLTLLTSVSALAFVCTIINLTSGMTTNERANWARYSYLIDSRGRLMNPFNRGFFRNVAEYFSISNYDERSSMNFENRWVLRSALNFASDGEIVREVASAREQDMEIYEKRKGHEQLDEQQS
ncbi:hypothetical protein HELRODRAFT_179371 [Helobdella robusta]|uniref:Uncharacterized protein n=1 Tax=Helobdella robusta TaxID=6412 RepID=T1FEM2_HELRO|nr:hypothetical protein HELRODRAFT_179371 [Helobdella robusta]ESN95594.1 hypothetical protein HELRODRAFT_179371 [Helobdella robusta]